MTKRFRERRIPRADYNVQKKIGVRTERFVSSDSVKSKSDVIAVEPFPWLKYQRCWDQTNPYPYRTGGPFLKYEAKSQTDGIQGIGKYTTEPSKRTTTYWTYEGGFAAPVFTGDSVSNYSNFGPNIDQFSGWIPDLTPLHSKAYDLLRPPLERASLAVSIKELTDLPKMLKTSAQGFHKVWKLFRRERGYRGRRWVNELKPLPKDGADHFLNHVFGWVPFVQDLRKMIDLTIFMEQYMHDAISANNTWIKRRRIVSHTENRTFINWSLGGVTPTGTIYDNMCFPMTVRGVSNVFAYAEQYEEEISHIWSEGEFKYYRPEFDKSLSDHSSAWSTMNRYATLYGLRINPSTVWRMTPWTWLTDWFANGGKVLQNHVDTVEDSRVSREVYLMCIKQRRRSWIQLRNFWTGAVQTTWYRNAEIKMREKGNNPFSFSIGSNGLTSSQLAILAALGLSRYS